MFHHLGHGGFHGGLEDLGLEISGHYVREFAVSVAGAGGSAEVAEVGDDGGRRWGESEKEVQELVVGELGQALDGDGEAIDGSGVGLGGEAAEGFAVGVAGKVVLGDADGVDEKLRQLGVLREIGEGAQLGVIGERGHGVN